MTPRWAPCAGHLASVFCGSICALLVLDIVGRDYPLVGHDLRYYVPRLLDTDLHLRLNGLAIQWYTPTFGGGVPAFPNPQHLQYSALQFVSYFANPWMALRMTTAVCVLVGVHVTFRFLHVRLGLRRLPSVLGALFFVANGFYIEHMIVGHVGFQLFPLGAVILYALTITRARVIVAGSIIALVTTAMVFQAGAYLVILLGLSLAVTLALLYVVNPGLIDPRRIALITALAGVLTAGMTAGKIHAVLAFMQHFPREVADVYDVDLLQGLAGFCAQMVGGMVLIPLAALAGLDTSVVASGLSRLTGASGQVGIWELDTGLSPVLTACLCVAAVQGLRRLAATGVPRIERRRGVALVVLGLVSWVMIEATLARGFVYPLIKELPILRSLHVNHRVAAVFILPLAITGAIWLDRWYGAGGRRLVMIALIMLTLAAPLAYLLVPGRVHLRTFDITESLATGRIIRSGARLPVEAVGDVTDAEALPRGVSSHRPYEPIFGYGLEAFDAQIRPGPIRDVRDAAFNLTNPASLVFPQINGLRPFDRISVADEANLATFASRGLPTWRIPERQGWLNALAIVALGASLSLMAFGARGRRAW